MNKISVVLITKNEEHSIKNCLDSLHDFDEVVIYDNGSEDKTLEIAKEYSNVKVSQGPFFWFREDKETCCLFS
jgi:glycosyltransferase involved in cell wall biosynthesis